MPINTPLEDRKRYETTLQPAVVVNMRDALMHTVLTSHTSAIVLLICIVHMQ